MNRSVYPSWDFPTRRIPTRSSFFSIPPLGMMNGMSECLTGFICRLDEAHSLSCESLMKEMLRYSNEDYHVSKLLTPSFRKYSGALNGIGLTASRWARIVSRCTLRPELEFLTFLPWKRMISPRGLIRQHSAWCPLCYEDWRHKEEIVYQPLIWCVRTVHVCRRHKCLLEERCPACHCLQNWLAPKSLLGYCSRCRHWLGLSEKSGSGLIQEDQWQYEVWKTMFVEALISHSWKLQSEFSRTLLSKFLSVLVDKYASGSISKFASQVHTRKNTLWGWKSGNLRISLPELIKICYCCGIEATGLLKFKQNGFQFRRKSIRTFTNSQSRKVKHHYEFDLKTIKGILECESQKREPQSLEKIAKRLRCSRRFLYGNFRELCVRISSAYQQKVCENRLQKRTRLLNEIRKAVINLHSTGVYPSRRAVDRVVRKYRDPNHRMALETLRNARRSLGID